MAKVETEPGLTEAHNKKGELKMINADELGEGKDFFFKEGNNITLSVIQSALTEAAGKYQIPIAFKNDQIKAGGLFNSTKTDCLIVYHPEHYSDYFRFTVSIKRQGIMAYVSINSFGRSTQANLHHISENSSQLRQQGKLGMAMLAGVVGLGKNKNKLENEENYYHAMEQIFNEVIGGEE